MSKDTIYREDAIKTLTENVMFEFTEDEEWAITCLQNLPSADRPQGEWIYTDNPLRLNDEWACSRCGNISFVRTNFCDRCGARMKGADDESVDSN